MLQNVRAAGLVYQDCSAGHFRRAGIEELSKRETWTVLNRLKTFLLVQIAPANFPLPTQASAPIRLMKKLELPEMSNKASWLA